MSGPVPAGPRPHGRRRKSKRRGEEGASPTVPGTPAAAVPGPATMPRFLAARAAAPRPVAADLAGPAEREARARGEAAGVAPGAAAGPTQGPMTERPAATPLGRVAAAAVAAHPGRGEPLPAGLRGRAEAAQGPLGDVRLHRRSALAAGFGANAVTYAGNVHLAPGAAEPGTPAGDRLIGHELAHLAQQALPGAPAAAQFDMNLTDLDTGLGFFHINATEASSAFGGGTATGLNTFIDFDPNEDSPYSTRIGLVQTVVISDVDDPAARPAHGQRSGAPEDTGIAGFDPARTRTLSTQGEAGSDEGWHVDVTNDTRPQHTEDEPWYLTSRGEGPDDTFGWNRGDGDVGRASLGDWPRWTTDKDFDFEVAAVAQDTRELYGVLRWGFTTIGGTVPDDTEYAIPVDVSAGSTTSANYDASLERWRNFYTHEPVAIYFDTASATPQAGQEDRLADIPAWMTANADAMIEISGFADQRGGAAANAALANQRAEAARQMLIDAGVPEDRILTGAAAARETTEFGAGGAEASTAGNLQANRRALIQFRRDRAAAGP